MQSVAHANIQITQLTPQIVRAYSHQIIEALDQIPQTDPHSLEQLLCERKADKILRAKWKHSYIALDSDGTFAGVIIGYERDKEDNTYYPMRSIYLSSLAISKKYQQKGLGKRLIQYWVQKAFEVGFIELSGPVELRVQTNRASWNEHVQRLYESCGFSEVGQKEYANRVDSIYRLTAHDA